MANEFIWHDPVEAQQAMSYAANAAKADLVKQENLYRMAELGLRRQQQQETAQLNQLITASQLQQRNIENQFRERELAQRGELERERNTNYLKGLQIQFPEGRTDSRLAVEASKQQFELEQQKKDEARDTALNQEWQILDQEIKGLQDALNKPKPGRGFLWLAPGEYNARVEQDKKTQFDLSSKVQRQKIIEAILSERGKVPTALRGAGPLTANQLQTAPAATGVLPEARLTPLEIQKRGLKAGSIINQGGQRYKVVPIATTTTSTGDQAIDEYTQRYPGVDFVRQGNLIRPGGFAWDDYMERVNSNPNLTPEVKQTIIVDYIRKKYPDWFY